MTSFGAWVNTNATVATTYYIDGSYTTNGIASIQGSAGNGVVGFTIQFKSPATLGIGTYSDTITMKGVTTATAPIRFKTARKPSPLPT